MQHWAPSIVLCDGFVARPISISKRLDSIIDKVKSLEHKLL